MKLLLKDETTVIHGVTKLDEGVVIVNKSYGRPSIQIILDMDTGITAQDILNLNTRGLFSSFSLLDENANVIITWKEPGSLSDVHSVYTDRIRQLSMLFKIET